MELSFRLSDREIVDRRFPALHQAVLVKLPKFVAEAPPLLAAGIVTFVDEANCYAVLAKAPKFLDESVLKLPGPLALQQAYDCIATGD
jgi:hypothetical protein